MYKDMYNTFDNECIPYEYPFSFQGNKQEYMVGNLPTYEMDYGDTTVFPFFITDEFLDFEVLITIYNFRHEPIYEIITYPDSDNQVYLVINNELSAKLYKGIYYIRLQAREKRLYANNDSTVISPTCTILSTQQCSLYIK